MPQSPLLPMTGLLCALALAGCASAPETPVSTLDASQSVTLTGELSYRARIALPPQAYALVVVRDSAGQVAAQSQWRLGGKQVPLPFTVTLPAHSQGPYRLEGSIFVSGRPAWVAEPKSLTPLANQENLGTLELQAAPPGAFASQLQCGSHQVQVSFTPTQMQMTVDNTRYAMAQVRAASGARYEATDQPGTVLWNKGSDNWVTVKGKALPECQSVGEANTLALTDQSWQVDSVNGQQVLDNSEVSVTFGSDGRVLGKASCNAFFGSYDVSGDRLTLHGLASTQKACVPALMAQEQQFLQALGDAQHFAFTNSGELLLYGPNGASIKAELKKE